MILTTERPLSNEDRMQMWKETLHRQGSGDCAPSTDGAAFSTEDRHVNDAPEAWWQACLGMIGLILFLTALIVVTALIVGPAPGHEPDCRMQFTNDVRYVKRCDFHDGRGYIEVAP